MALSFVGDTPDDLIADLEEMSKRTQQRVRTIILKGAKDIMQASRDMSPVDTGALMAAHHMEITRDDGIITSIEVIVGGEVDGRDVDEYAELMHEGLAPFGSGFAGSIFGASERGEPPSTSELKNAANPGDRPVGGKFLERAVDLFVENIMTDVENAMPGTR